MHVGHARILRASGVLFSRQKALGEPMLAAVWQSVDAAKSASLGPLRRAAEGYLADLVSALIADVEAVGIVALARFDLGAWARELEPALRGAVLETVEQGWGTGLLRIDRVQPWDPADPEIVARATALIDKSRTVPETALQQARTAARRGVLAGDDRDALTARVRKALDGVPSTNAERIARTTGTGAFSAGQVSAWTAAGVSRHAWLSSRDADVRESHDALDGEDVEIGATFSNGLRWPADPMGDVSEVVNCRCDLLPVEVGDLPEDPDAAKAAPASGAGGTGRDWRRWRDARLAERYEAVKGAHRSAAEAFEAIAQWAADEMGVVVSARTVERAAWGR